MLSRTVIIILIAAGMISLIAGGVYYRFARLQTDAAVPYPASSALIGSGQSGRSFVMHETPQPVPALAFVNNEGRSLSLVDFRGRTILLNIWATWCVPCRKEMPALDRLQAKLGSPAFEVVTVSIDRDGILPVWAFFNELGLKALGIYVDTSGKAAQKLGAIGIPITLLINPDGEEVGRLIGPAEWDSVSMIRIIQQQLEKTPAKGAEIVSGSRRPA